jgi:predicted regulator of Ras-like GTPase activity (Roadblock/LC7/MglB family)
MENVFDKILQHNKNVNVMLVSKNGKYIKSNMIHQRALEKSACVLNFLDKARFVMQKILPDESLENIRIKGRKNNEIFITHDDQLEIVVIQNFTGH